MIARQCSSCGGICGGGYTVNGKYKFCKAENPKKKPKEDYYITVSQCKNSDYAQGYNDAVDKIFNQKI